MSDYAKNIAVFYARADYEELSGVRSAGGRISFKKLAYHARRGRPLPAAMADKVLAQAAGQQEDAESCLYLHIPFCNLRCSYCDFYRHHFTAEAAERYVSALLAELQYLRRRGIFSGRMIKAVFFGGGTPSVLSSEQLAALLRGIREAAVLAPDCELTVESSLYDMDEAKLVACLENGVSRFSIGIQSFDSSLRRALGRTHSCKEAAAGLRRLADSGADVVIDLIYGLPGQTRELLLEDLRLALDCGISGLDLYRLQLMPRSPLGQAVAGGRLAYEHDEDSLVEMFLAADAYLAESGARELSCCHWAMRKSERSLYNTMVKNGTDIVACGSSCGGRLGAYQYMKVMDKDAYSGKAHAGAFPVMAFIKQSGEYRFLERLSGQCDRGLLDFAGLAAVSGAPWTSLLQPLLEKWERLKLLQPADSAYKLTGRGKFAYRQLTRVLLTAAEYALYGSPGVLEQAGQKLMGVMKNLK